MNDTIQRGIIAGILGTLGDSIIHLSAFFSLGTSTTEQYISQLLFPFKDVNLLRWIYGFAIHLMVGALIAVVLSLILKWFGTDYPYYKGLAIAMASLIVHIIVIPNLVAPRPFLFRTELEVLIDSIGHTVFGIIATFYLVKFSYEADKFCQ